MTCAVDPRRNLTADDMLLLPELGLAQIAALSAAIVAKILKRRREAKRKRLAEPRARRYGPGSRPNKSKGAPRRGWLQGLDRWRLSSKSRPNSYEVAFLRDVEHWGDDPNATLYKEFERQFRIPYPMFEELMDMTHDSGLFRDSTDKSCRGPRPAPLTYKVLASLRYMATGVSFKSLEIESGISAATIARFYTLWIQWLVDTQVHKWVYIPSTVQEIGPIHSTYHMMGLPGCVGSMDGVHVAWDMCPQQQRFLYKGKEGYPTIAWNVTCTHSGWIIHVNGPHPGGRNDKNMAQLDEMVSAVRHKPVFTGLLYNMLKATGEIFQSMGAWILCDGGYHRWVTTVCGYKHTADKAKHLWSKRMESVRKDVENVFGHIKKRFRCLRLPFLLTTEKDIDNTFRVCCMLHNWLLSVHGLSAVGLEANDWKDTNNAIVLDAKFQTAVELSRLCIRMRDRNGNRIRIDQDSDFLRVEAIEMDEGGVGVQVERGYEARREALTDHYYYAASHSGTMWLRTRGERDGSS